MWAAGSCGGGPDDDLPIGQLAQVGGTGVGGAGEGGAGGESFGDEEACRCLSALSYENGMPSPAGVQCANCINLQNDSGKPCYIVQNDCINDPTCYGVFMCLSDTGYSAEGIHDCALNLPPGSEALLYATTSCWCEACADLCQPEPACPDPPAPVPENCQCMLDLSAVADCTICADDATLSTCQTERLACDADTACVTIVDTCIPACETSADPAACVDACLGEESDPSRALAEAFYSCVCDGACSASCSGDATTCGP